MPKCKCKFPVMTHVANEGFKCQICGLWVLKCRKHWYQTKIAEAEKKAYDRKKEKKVDEE